MRFKHYFVPHLLQLVVLCFVGISANAQVQYYTVAGNASVLPSGDGVELTPNAGYQGGWAIYETKFNLAVKDSLIFKVYLGNSDAGADGMVFFMHNDSRGLYARGCVGGTMGYGTHDNGISSTECGSGTRWAVTPSIAVEFDTYQNGGYGDPVADHVAYLEGGNVVHGTNYVSTANMEDGAEHDFKMVWDPAVNRLQVYYDNTIMVDTIRDLINGVFGGTTQVYWGFSASTGGAQNQQYFRLIQGTIGIVSTTAQTAQSGNWSSASTWVGGSIPSPDDSIIVNTGHTVTIDQAVTSRALQILGTLQFEQTTARTILVNNNVNIASGGVFQTNTGTQNGHILQIGGDLINAGTLDFQTGTSARATIQFTNQFKDQNINLSGATLTDFGDITLTKGNNTYAVNLLSNLSLPTGRTLTLTYGRLAIGSNTLTLNGTVAYANGASINGSTSSNITIAGTITNGLTFTTGAQTLNNLTVGVSATLNTPLTVGGALSLTAGTLTQGTTLALNGTIALSGGTLAAGTNALTIGASSITRSAGGITLGAGSVTFTNTASLNVPASTFSSNFNNLIINGSGGVTMNENEVVNNDITLTTGTWTMGAFTLSVAGNWTNNGGVYSGTGAVTFTGTTKTISGTTSTSFPGIIVADAATITMNNNNSCTALTINTGAAVTSFTHGATGVLTVNGSVTLNQPTANAARSWNINAGSSTVTGNVTIGSSSGTNNRIAQVVITTGTLTVTGNITISVAIAANGVLNIGAGGTVNLGGAFTLNTVGTLTANATSNFNYNGTGAQTVNMGVNYGNLILNNSNASGATLSAAVSGTNVIGNLTVASGILNNGGFAIAGLATKTLTVSSGATLNLTGTSVFPTNFGTFTIDNNSTIGYTGGAQTIAARQYGHLNLSGATVSKTPAAGTLTVNGNLTIGTTVTFAGNTNNPTVTLLGNFTNNGTFTSGTGTYTFSGTGTQTLSSVTNPQPFGGGVTISGSGGNVTLAQNITVASTLVINSGATLNLSTFTANRATSAAGPFTISGTLKLANNTGGQTGSNFPSNYTTITINNTSTVEYNGSNAITQTVYSSGTTIYNKLILTNGTGSGTAQKVSTASFAIMDTFQINTGVIFTPAAANIISGSGTGAKRLVGPGAAVVTGSSQAAQYTLTVDPSVVIGNGGSIAAGSYTSLFVTSAATLAGNITVNGDVTIASGVTLDASTSNYNISVSGNWINNGTYTARTGTVTFNGATQTISGSSATSFHGLTISSTVSTTLAANITIADVSGSSLTISAGSTLDLGTFTANRAGTTGTRVLTINGTLKLGAATGGQGNSNYPTNFTAPPTMGTNGLVEYNGSNSITQNVYETTYSNLKLTNGSGSGNAAKTSGATNYTITGTFNVGTLVTYTPTAANTIGGAGRLTGEGAIVVNRTAATADLNNQYTITTKDLDSLTVNYSPNAAQTVNGYTYGGLTISGGNTKTLGGATDVNGTLTISAGTLATGNNTLTVAGNWVNNGTAFTAGTSTVTFDGTTAQTISGSTATAFNNLTLSNTTDTLFATTNLSVAGTLTVNTSADFSPAATVVVSGTGTLTGNGTILVTTTGTTPWATQYSITNKTLTNLTVNYSSTGAQTIAAVNYGNLQVSGSRTTNSITLAGAGTIGIAGTFANTATYTSGGVIVTGSTVDFNGTGAQSIPAINLNNLTISGAKGNNTVTLAAGTIGLAGTLSVTATGVSSYITTGNTIDYNGTGSQTIGAFNYYNLTSSSSGARTLVSSGTIGVAGTFTPGTNSYTNTNSTIDFYGAGAQTIPAFNYNNLTLSGVRSGSPAITLSSGTIGVAGNLNITAAGIGSYVNTGNTIDYNGTGAQTIAAIDYNNLTSSSSGSRTLASSGTIGVAGTFTPGTNSYTNTGSTIEFKGSSSQTIPAFNYNNLTSSSTGARVLASSGTVGIAGTFTPGTNSYTITGSTVDYNGTGAQTVGAMNYNNLSISGAHTTNSVTLSSGTIYVAGTFNPSATYTSGGYIITGNEMDFNGSGSQTIPVFNYNDLQTSGSRGANSITFASGIVGVAGTFNPSASFTTGAFIITGNTIDFNGTGSQSIPSMNYNNITISGTRIASPNVNIFGTVGVAGVFTYTATGATLVKTGSTFNYNGTGAQTITIFDYNNLTISGARSGSPAITLPAGTVGVAGTFSVTATGVTYTTTGNTVDFNGSGAQTIGAFNFNNLTLSAARTGSPAITLGTGTIGVSGIFSLTATGIGSYVTTGNTVNYTGTGAQNIVAINYNNLTSSSTGARTLASSGTIGVAGTFTPGTNSYTNTGSTIDYNNTTGGQTVALFTYNNLTTSNTSGTQTAAGNLTVNVLTTVAGGTLNMGTNTLSATTITNGGTIRTQNTSGTPLPTGITIAGTVNYDAAAGGQTIRPNTYTNLTMSNTGGTQTATADLSPSGTLTTTAGGTLNMVTFALSAGTITNGGTIRTQSLSSTSLPNGLTIGGTVTYDATTGGQTIGGNTYTTLTMGNTSGTQTAGANITATTLNNNTAGIILNMSTYTLGATTINNNATATIRTQSTSTTPLPTGLTIAGIVNYDAATGGQTIRANTYTTLTLGNTSGSQTASGAITATTLNNNTNAADTLNMGANTLAATTLNNTGTIRTQSTAAAPLPTGLTIGGTVIYDAATGGQSVRVNTYNNLISANTSGTNTALGNLVVNGTFTTVAGGTLSLSTFTLSGTLTSITNNGTLTTASTNATPIPTGKTWGGLVNYNGTTTQTIVAGSYTNLTISGAHTTNNVTLVNGGTISVSGTFSPTATFTGAGTYVTTSNTIDFNGTGAQTLPAFSYNNLTLSGARTGSPVITLASGTINVAGNFTFTSTGIGSYVTTGNTVNYTGAGAQSIAAINYNNLTSSSTGARTLPSSGSVGVAGTFTPGTNTYTITGSTIDFNGTGAQTLPVFSYNNLALSGSRTGSPAITLASGTINVAGNFTFGATGVGSYVTTGNTVNYNGAAQTVANITYGGLTISGTGLKTLSGNTTVNSDITVGGTSGLNASSYTLDVKGNWINNATFTPATSTVSFSGSTAQTLSGSSAPTFNNLTVNNTSGVSMSYGVTVGGICTLTSGALSIGANTLTLNGTVTGTGSFVGGNTSSLAINGTGAMGTVRFTTNTNLLNLTLNRTSSGTVTLGSNVAIVTGGSFTLTDGVLDLGANTISVATTITRTNGTMNGSLGNLIMNGSTSQTIPASLFTSNTLAALGINNAAGVNLGGTLLLTDSLKPTAGTLTTGGYLTLVSNATKTARIANGGCTTCSYISGNVAVQRYIPGVARKWRFMGSSVSGTTLSDWKNEIYITGTGGASNGFDATVSNQASVYGYNESLITGDLNTGWEQATNITNSLVMGKGYRVFIRGDRSDAGRLTGTNTTQNAVTMDLVGPVYSGDITMPVTYTSSGNVNNDGWCLLSNPYPCPYDWKAHYAAGSYNSNVSADIWILNAQGAGYETYNANSSMGGLTSGIIPSGASFWVKATAGSPTLTFKEQFKVGATPLGVFKTDEGEGFSIRLETDSINYDRMFVKYMDASTAGYDTFDTRKLPGTISISSYGNDNVQLAANARPTVTTVDTIKLNVSGAAGSYKLIFTNSDEIAIQENLLLMDNYLGTATDLSTTGSYSFDITTAAASKGLNRFYIIVGNSSSLPVKLLTFKARKAENRTVALGWSTAQETNNSHFDVQRSTDGITYETIGTVKGNGTTSRVINYSFTDANPKHMNYYRLKQVDFNGEYHYSQVQLVNMDEIGAEKLTLYPNPVVDVVTFSTPNQTHFVSYVVYDLAGVEVLRGDVPYHSTTLNLQGLNTGVYVLTLTDEQGNRVNEKLIKE